jgi:hypothetical protein
MDTFRPGNESSDLSDQARITRVEQGLAQLELGRLEQALRAAGALPNDAVLSRAAEALARQGVDTQARSKLVCSRAYCVIVRK